MEKSLKWRYSIKEAGIVKIEVSPEEHAWLVKLVALYRRKMSYMNEIVELSALFFRKDFEVENEQAKEVLQKAKQFRLY